MGRGPHGPLQAPPQTGFCFPGAPEESRGEDGWRRGGATGEALRPARSVHLPTQRQLQQGRAAAGTTPTETQRALM